jgi:hypothetical protein
LLGVVPAAVGTLRLWAADVENVLDWLDEMVVGAFWLLPAVTGAVGAYEADGPVESFVLEPSDTACEPDGVDELPVKAPIGLVPPLVATGVGGVSVAAAGTPR